ncbi:MAG: GNAT family N-acetyltransferase [Deltaproteobacteria bacterium]|nr:GNAT family N-acetyltransferase [Deltaproteobacteria bacterium]
MLRRMQARVDVLTPRLRLRNLSPGDTPLVLHWATDADVVRNFSFFEHGADPARIRAYIEEKERSAADLLLAVMERVDSGEQYAGNVGLHEWDPINDNARLGIILQQAAWGRGVAQEAICGLLGHAFTSLRLHKVYLNVFTTNDKGIHLYGKLGFVHEGVMRAEYKLRGEYRDMLRMSILRTEWPTPAARGFLEGA